MLVVVGVETTARRARVGGFATAHRFQQTLAAPQGFFLNTAGLADGKGIAGKALSDVQMGEDLAKLVGRAAMAVRDEGCSLDAALRFVDWMEPLLRRESYLALLVERPSVQTRLLRLLSLLQTRSHWLGPELAERLEVHPRTLRRDVDRLRQLGYPVQASSGVAGGDRKSTRLNSSH